MKLHLIVPLCCVLTSLPGFAQDTAPIDEEAPPAEIEWKNETFHLVFADLSQARIDLVWKDAEGNQITGLGNAADYIEKTFERKFIFATNTGMFKPDYSPVGLHIENGTALVPLDKKTKAPGNFYLQPNGIFFVDQSGRAGVVETGKFSKRFPAETWKDTLALATQSGPMLVVDGRIHSAFKEGSVNKYVRSGVGIMGPQTVVFAISKNPVNFHTFASLFRDLLRCKNALYLDGAVSKFHAPGSGLENPGGGFGGILVVSE